MRGFDRQSSLRDLAIGGLGEVPCELVSIPGAEGDASSRMPNVYESQRFVSTV